MGLCSRGRGERHGPSRRGQELVRGFGQEYCASRGLSEVDEGTFAVNGLTIQNLSRTCRCVRPFLKRSCMRG